MIFSKLNRLAVLGTLLLAGAAPQAAAPKTAAPKTATPPGAPAAGAAKPAAAAAGTQEISEHPEILTMDFTPSMVTLFGVHVGDKTAKVPVPKMDRLTGTVPGLMKLQNNYQLRYNPTTLTITALVVSDRLTLLHAGLQDRYDVEFKFGKPDISDDRHAVWLSRRLLATFNSTEITGLEVR